MALPSVPRICEIEGCNLPRHGSRWCQKHYLRNKKTGDPLGRTRYDAKCIRVVGDVAYIELSRGEVAQVDASDLPMLAPHKWSCWVNRTRRYAHATIDGKKVKMHRLILCFPDGVVDHQDGDGLNNTRSNLRVTDASGNARNANRATTTGYRGVIKRRGRWVAQISAKGQKRGRYLGSFRTAEDAARAYDVAAQILHGEFAVLNFP